MYWTNKERQIGVWNLPLCCFLGFCIKPRSLGKEEKLKTAPCDLQAFFQKNTTLCLDQETPRSASACCFHLVHFAALPPLLPHWPPLCSCHGSCAWKCKCLELSLHGSAHHQTSPGIEIEEILRSHTAILKLQTVSITFIHLLPFSLLSIYHTEAHWFLLSFLPPLAIRSPNCESPSVPLVALILGPSTVPDTDWALNKCLLNNNMICLIKEWYSL